MKINANSFEYLQCMGFIQGLHSAFYNQTNAENVLIQQGGWPPILASNIKNGGASNKAYSYYYYTDMSTCQKTVPPTQLVHFIWSGHIATCHFLKQNGSIAECFEGNQNWKGKVNSRNITVPSNSLEGCLVPKKEMIAPI